MDEANIKIETEVQQDTRRFLPSGFVHKGALIFCHIKTTCTGKFYPIPEAWICAQRPPPKLPGPNIRREVPSCFHKQLHLSTTNKVHPLDIWKPDLLTAYLIP